MADERRIPTQSELEALYDKLVANADEMDATTASELLDISGIGARDLVADFEIRLNNRITQIQAKGDPLPLPMLEALEGIRSRKSESDSDSDFDPAQYIDALLSGDLAKRGNFALLQSFRGRNAALSREDRRVLDDLAAEIDAGDES